MSYFDSLSQFQQAQEQISEHTKSMEQEQLNAKATDLQSRYEYAEKQLNEVAGFTTSIGAGIHGARRSYLKVKKGFEDIKEKAQKLKDKVEGNPDSENTGKDTEGTADSHNNVANGQESDRPVENNTKAANQEDLEDRVENTADPEGANNQVKGERDPNEPDPASAEKSAPENPEPSAEAQQNVENRVRGAEEPDEVEGSETIGGGTLNEDESRVVNNEGAKEPAELGDAQAPEGGASNLSNGAEQISESAKNNLSDLANQGEEAVNMGGDAVQGATDSLVSGAKDIISKALPETTDAVSGAVSTGLETAGAVADFLGPVGEIVGAGIALGSFFHDLFAKKKEDQAEAEAESTPTATAGKGGLDTSNLAQASVKSNVVGTIV